MAQAEDVVLYDLEDTDDVATLEAMLADSESRWYARARLAGLAIRGDAKLEWNPLLHPRGPDGRFIHTYSWVRWLANGKWRRGQVTKINPDTGHVNVHFNDPGSTLGKDTTFTSEQAAKMLYAVPAPKAQITLPDPKTGKEVQAFTQVGGQGGSNPGGMFQVTDKAYGGPGTITIEQLEDIKSRYGLGSSTGALDTSLVHGSVVGYHPDTQEVYYAPLKGGPVKIYDTQGNEVDPPLGETTWLFGDKLDLAWGEIVGAAALFNPGQKVYVKHAKSPDHARNEVLANRLYEAAGVNVPETILGDDGITVASKVVPEVSTKVDIKHALDDPEAMTRMREDFVIDAWLANWDVVGLGLENTQVVDGHPYRIDAGGALLYRAQGAPKGSMFGPTVGELKTLRDSGINPQSAKVFKDVTDDDIKTGAERIAAISPDAIHAMVDAHGMPSSLADTLVARRDFILAEYGVIDPWAPNIVQPEPTPTVMVPEGATLPDEAPEVPEVKPADGPKMVWSTTDQTWVESANPPKGADIYLKLSALYDDGDLFHDEDAGSFPFVGGEIVYALRDGQLYEITGYSTNPTAGRNLDVRSVSTGEQTTLMQQDGPMRVMRATEANEALIKAAVANIAALEKLWREETITYEAGKNDIANVFWNAEQDLMPGQGPMYGTPYAPEFKAELTPIYTYSNGTVSTNHPNAKYVWNPDTEKIHQVINDPQAGEPLQLMNPITGASVDVPSDHYNNMQDVQIVAEDDSFSIEMIEAYIQRAVAELGDEAPSKESIEPETAESLEEKAEPLLPEPGTVIDPDPIKLDTAITRSSAYFALDHALNFLDVDASSQTGIKGDFKDKFLGGTTYTWGEFEQWADSHMLTLKVPMMAWLNEHPSFIETPGDLPDPSEGIHTTVPQHIPGVSDELHVSAPFKFGDLDDNAERMQKAASLVGKMMLLKLDGLETDSEGTISLKHSHGNSPVMTLAHVEEVDGPTMWLRLPTGEKKSLNIVTSAPNLHADWYEVDNFDVEFFKQTPTPTLKTNGEITYAGQVVGTWQKKNWYYEFTLDGAHTLSGSKITGTVYTKSGLKGFVTYKLVPKAVPTKPKKSSPAAKKIIDSIAPSIAPLESKYADGTQVQLGDWVKSTKGGGGFVGKIVGWPNQEKHPGLVFAVDENGVQKAVKVSTQKKVEGPDLPFTVDVPTAYKGLKLADGKEPQVGQLVTAGKPGSTQVTGIVTNIHTGNGWVYILEPGKDKPVSKTFNVTKVVEESDLIWDASDQAIVPSLQTKVTPKSPGKKTGTIDYPGPDGAVIEQSQEFKDAWLEQNPKRKLTKDGFVPQVGMRVRNSAGDEFIIFDTAGEWDPNPNKVKAYNITKKKMATTSTTSIKVDHEAELTGYDGEKLKGVAGVHFMGITTPQPDGLPDGTVIYRYSVKKSYYSKSQAKTRFVDDWQFLVVQPDGSVHATSSGSYGPALVGSAVGSGWQGLPYFMKWHKPEHVEKLAVIDSKSPGTVIITPSAMSGNYPEQQFHASKIGFAGLDDEDAPSPAPVSPSPAPEPEAVATVTDTPDPLPDVAEPGDESVPEPTEPLPTPDPTEAVPVTEAVGKPEIIDSGSLTTVKPPPNPTPKKTTAKVDPEPPQVTGAVSLDEQHPLTKQLGASSMEDAALEMIQQKDSKAPGTSRTYSVGDSDYVEDMAIRFSVEKRADGTEHLVARFRLREDVAEDTIAHLVTSGEGKVGAWKLEGMKYPKELVEGDQIAVYLSGTTGLLKPASDGQHPMDEPNVHVAGPPKLIGKSEKNPDVDLYRVPVVTDQGVKGEVDMEHRPGASIQTFVYDHDAPAKATGSNLHLTATAQGQGWSKIGKITMPGSVGSVHIDETGKVTWPGSTVGDMAGGTGGHRMKRNMPDGSIIVLNAAHGTEGGTGFGTTRRANVAGEVTISTPIPEGRPEEDVLKSISEAMQAVGLPADKQGAPSDQQLATLALNKLVTNYHPSYDYRGKPVESADDKRVTETLAHMSSRLQKHLGRNVTLNDVRLHTFPSGRIGFVFSPEVAKAISKSQGSHHYHHSGASSRVVDIFAGTANGLMSTDERWSLGVMTTGQSSAPDMRNGAGDRVFMRTVVGPSYSNHHVILNPLVVNSSLELYTKSMSDSWGKRTGQNLTLDKHSGGYEFNYKRLFESEYITFYIVGSESERSTIIQKIKAKGVTHVGSRAIEEIIVTADQAKKVGNFEDIGLEHFKDDVPIDGILGIPAAPAAAGAPAAV